MSSEFSRRERERRRTRREQMMSLAWVFIASPLAVLVFGRGRYSIWEAALLPTAGVAMLVWSKRHASVPEHVAAVEFVRPDDGDEPDACPDPFFLAWCDCGWSGKDHGDEASARAEAQRHTPDVQPGLHAFLE